MYNSPNVSTLQVVDEFQKWCGSFLKWDTEVVKLIFEELMHLSFTEDVSVVLVFSWDHGDRVQISIDVDVS